MDAEEKLDRLLHNRVASFFDETVELLENDEEGVGMDDVLRVASIFASQVNRSLFNYTQSAAMDSEDGSNKEFKEALVEYKNACSNILTELSKDIDQSQV